MPSNSIGERVALRVLRAVSPEWRARTDLFYEPYKSWIDWHSGLGDGGRLLHTIVRMLRPSVIVEIGSARGYSTCAFSLGCSENGHGMVYAIDPHAQNDWTDVGTGGATEDFLRERLRSYQLEPYCTILKKTSVEAAAGWSKNIDLLFIDGDHTMAGVRNDFEAFGRWVGPEGLLIFHDSAWEHDKPWVSYKGEDWYREDMGVPAYLEGLQANGYKSVTFMPTPGMAVMHPTQRGFEFLRRCTSEPTGANREHSAPDHQP